MAIENSNIETAPEMQSNIVADGESRKPIVLLDFLATGGTLGTMYRLERAGYPIKLYTEDELVENRPYLKDDPEKVSEMMRFQDNIYKAYEQRSIIDPYDVRIPKLIEAGLVKNVKEGREMQYDIDWNEFKKNDPSYGFYHATAESVSGIYGTESGDFSASAHNIVFDKEGRAMPKGMAHTLSNPMKKIQLPGDESTYFWAEAQDGEFVDADIIKGSFDREMTSSWYNSFLKGMWRSSLPLLVKGTGAALATFGNLTDQLVHWDSDYYDPEASWNRLNVITANWANSKGVLHVDERAGVFEDHNAFLLQLGDTVGQILGIILTGGAATGVLKGVGVAGRALNIMRISPAFGEAVGTQVGLAMGGFEAMGMVQDELKKMGFSDADISHVLPFYGLAAYASENIFNANIVQRFGPRVANRFIGTRTPPKKVAEAVNNTVGKEIFKTGKALSQLSSQERRNILRTAWQKVMRGRNWIKEKSIESAGFRYAFSGLEEGMEEYAEGFMDMGIAKTFNSIQETWAENFMNEDQNFEISENKFDGEAYGVEGQQTFTLNSPYIKRNIRNPRDVVYLTQEDYNKYTSQKKLAQDILDGSAKLDTSISPEEGLMAALGTWLTFAPVAGLGRNKVKGSIIRMSHEMERKPYLEKQFEDQLMEMARTGQSIYSNKVTSKGEPIKDGDWTKSHAADMARVVMEDIKLWRNIIRKYGLNSKEVNHAMNFNKGLARRATEIAASIESFNKALASINNKEEVEENKELGITKESTVEELTKKKDDAVKKLDSFIRVKTEDGKVVSFIDKNGNEKKAEYSEQYSSTWNQIKAFDQMQDEQAEEYAKNTVDKSIEIGTKAYHKEINKLKKNFKKDYFKKENFVERMKTEYKMMGALVQYEYSDNSTIANLHAALKYNVDEHNRKISEPIEKESVTPKLSGALTSMNAIVSAVQSGDISDVLSGQTSKVLRDINTLMTDVVGRTEEATEGVKEPVFNFLGDGTTGTGFTTALKSLEDSLKAIDTAEDQVAEGMIGQVMQDISKFTTTIGKTQPKTITSVNDLSGEAKDDMMAKAFSDSFNAITIRDENNNETTIGDLLKKYGVYADKKNESGIEKSREVLDILEKIGVIADMWNNFLDLNKGYFQDIVEADDTTKEHSKLILKVNNDKRFTQKQIDMAREQIGSQKELVEKLIPIVQKFALSRELDETKQRINSLDIKLAVIDMVKAIDDDERLEAPKLPKEFFELYGSTIKALQDAGFKQERKQLQLLWEEYRTAKGDENEIATRREELNIVLNTVETAVLKIYDTFSGNLDKQIDIVIEKSKSRDDSGIHGYSDLGDFENMTVQKRADAELSGGYSRIMFERGMMESDMFEGNYPNTSEARKNEGDAYDTLDQFYFIALTEMNNANRFGQGKSPSYSEVHQSIRDMFARRAERAEKKPDSYFVSTYEQQQLLIHAISFYFNPDNEMVEGTDRVSYLSDLEPILKSLYIRGYAGTGKSTQFIDDLIETLTTINGGKKLKIAVVVPTDNLEGLYKRTAARYEDDLDGGKMDIFYKSKAGNIDYAKYDFVIFEEVTLHTKQDTEDITVALNEVNKKSKGTPAFFIGDDAQAMIMNIDEEGTTFFSDTSKYHYIMERTVPITNVYRSGIVVLHELQNKLRIQKFSKGTIEIDQSGYSVNEDGEKSGVETFKTKQDIIDSFLAFLGKPTSIGIDEKTAIVVVRSAAEADEAIALGVPEKFVKYIYPSNTERDHTDLISGTDALMVFVAFDINSESAEMYVNERDTEGMTQSERDDYLTTLSTNLEQDTRNISKIRLALTAVTRAKRYVALINDKAQNLNDHTHTYGDANVLTFKDEITRLDTITEGNATYKEDKREEDDSDFNYELEDKKAVETKLKKEIAKLKKRKTFGKMAHISVAIKDFLVANDIITETEPNEDFYARGRFYRNIMKYIGDPSESLKKTIIEDALRIIHRDDIDVTKTLSELYDDESTRNKGELFSDYYITVFAQMSPAVRSMLLDDLTVISPIVKVNDTMAMNPFAIRIVGYANQNDKVVPIVDIIDINQTTYTGYESITKSPILKMRLGAYANILSGSGYIINNIHVITFDMDETKGDIKNNEIVTLTPEQRTEVSEDAVDFIRTNNISGDEIVVTTKEQYYEAERSVPDAINRTLAPDSKYSAMPGDVHRNNKGQLFSIVKITAKTEGDSVAYNVHLKDNKGAVTIISDTKLKKDYSFIDVKHTLNLFEDTMNKFFEKGKRRMWGTSSVFVITDPAKHKLPNTGEDWYNLKKNTILKLRHLILPDVINADPILTKKYHESVKLVFIDQANGNLRDTESIQNHVVVNQIDDDALIEELVAKINTSTILKKDITVRDFIAMGLHIVNIESQPEIGFKDEANQAIKLFTKNEDSETYQKAIKYIGLKKQDTKLLDEIFESAFMEDRDEEKREALIEMNKYRLETIRRLNKGEDLKVKIVSNEAGRLAYSPVTSTLMELQRLGKKHGYEIVGEPILKREGDRNRFMVTFRRDGFEDVEVFFDGAKIKKNEVSGYKEELLSEIRELRERFEKRNREGKPFNFENDIGDAVMTSASYMFIKANTNLTHDKGVVNERYAGLFKNRNGRVVLIEYARNYRKLQNLLDSMEKAVQYFSEEKELYYSPFVIKNGIKSGTNFNRLIANAYDFTQPNIYTSLVKSKKKEKAGVVRTLDSGIKFDEYSKKMDYEPEPSDTISHQEAFDEISAIIGEAHVRSGLDKRVINPEANLKNRKGEDVFGLLDGMVIRLRDINGTVEKDAPRHESMHYVMVLLLTSKQQRKALKDAKMMMAEEGLMENVAEITDQDAHEYIASIFEDGSYVNKTYPKRSWLDKFFDFLREFFGLYMRNRQNLMNILYSAEAGKFQNAEIQHINAEEFSKYVENRFNSPNTNKKIERVFGTRNFEAMTNRILHAELMPTLLHDYFPTSKVLQPGKTGRSLYEALFNLGRYYQKSRTKMQYHDNGKEKMYSYIPAAGKKKISKPISKFTKDDFQRAETYLAKTGGITKTNVNFLTAYIKFHMSDSIDKRGTPLFAALLARAMPGINFEHIYNDKSVVFGSTSNQIFKDPKSEGNDVNPYDTKSDVLEVVTKTIPYYKRKEIYEDEDFRVSYGFVNSQNLDRLLTQSMLLLWSNNQGKDFNMKIWMDTIEEMENSMPDSVDRNTLFSFRVFIGNYGRENFTTTEDVLHQTFTDANTGVTKLIGVGYMHLISDFYNKGIIYQTYTEGNQELGFSISENEYRKKIENMDDLMSAFNTFYGSLYNRITVIAEDEHNFTKFKMREVSNSERLIKRSIIQPNIMNSILNGNDMGVSDAIANALDDDNPAQQFIIVANEKEQYVADTDGNVLINIDLKQRKKITNIKKYQKDIQKLMRFMGININLSTIRKLKDPNTNSYNNLIRDVFLTMLSLKVNSMIYDHTIDIYEDFSVGKISRDELVEQYDEITEGAYSILADGYKEIYKTDYYQPEDKVGSFKSSMINPPSPLDFYKFINGISDTIRYEAYSNITMVGYNVKGKLMYGYVPGSFYSDMTPVSVSQDKTSSDLLVERVEKMRKEHPEGEPSPLVTGDQWHNSIMSGYIGYDTPQYTGGMKYIDKGERFNYLTMSDKWDFMIKRLEENILHQGFQKFPVILDPFADSNTVPITDMYIKGTTETGKIVSVKYKEVKGRKTLERWDIRYKMLIPAVYKIYDYYKNLQRIKQDKWNAITKDKKVKVGSSIGNKLQKALAENSEYIIKGGYILPGNEITQEGNPVLNLKYTSMPTKSLTDNEWKSRIADLKKAFKEVLTINNEGYVLSEHNDLDLDIYRGFRFNYTDGKSYTIGELVDRRDLLRANRDYGEELGEELMFEDEVPTTSLEQQLTDANDKLEYARTKVREKKFKYRDNYHPMLETLFWTNYIFGESMNQLMRGTQYGYTSYIDYIKRGKGLIAPGIIFDLSRKNLIPKNSRVLHVEDVSVTDALFTRTKAGDKEETIKATDGMSIITPIFNEKLRMAQGGILSNLGQGSLKTVNFNYNALKADGTYMKFNMFPTSKSGYFNDPFYQSFMQMTLGDVLFEKFNQYYADNLKKSKKHKAIDPWQESIYDMIQYLKTPKGIEEGKNMIDYVVFHSSNKMMNKNVNKLQVDDNGNIIWNPELNNEENIIYESNKSLRLQIITKQDTLSSNTSMPRQELNNIIALEQNQEIAREIENIMASSVNEAINTVNDTKDIEALVRGSMIVKSTHSKDPFKVGSLLKNKSVNPFVFQNKAVKSLLDVFNDSYSPRLKGAFHVQAMGTSRIIYGKDGKPYLKEDFERLGIDTGKVAYTELRPISFLKENQNPYTSYNSLEKDVKAGKGITVRPADVVAPFVERDYFGLSKETTLVNAMTVKLGDTIINLYENTSVDDRITEDQYYKKFRETGLDNITFNREAYKNIRQKASEVEGYDEMSDRRKETVILKEAARYYKEFNDALDVFFVRIPTTMASMGAPARIVAFDNGVENTLYVSAKKNILDGSDWDADQLNVIYRDRTDKTKRDIFDTIYSFYKNPQNYKLILSRIDIKPLRAKYDKRIEEIGKKEFYQNTLGSNVVMSDIINDGAVMVGHFVNLSTYFYKIMSLPMEVKEEYGLSEQFMDDDKFIEVINIISTLVQGATDNAKEGGILGVLNLNEYTSPLVAGILFEGFTEEDVKGKDYEDLLDKVIKIVNSKTVVEATRKTRISKKLSNKYPTRINKYLSDKKLTEYYNTGEQLRRYGDSITIIKGFDNIFDLNRKIQFLEFNLGKDLRSFITEQTEVPVEEQLTSITDNRIKNFFTDEEINQYYASEEEEIKKIVGRKTNRLKGVERGIRETLDIGGLVLQNPQLIAYIQSLIEIKDSLDRVKMERLFKESIDNTMFLLKEERIFNEDAFNAYRTGFQDYLIGQFISETYKKHEHKSQFLKDNNYKRTKFDMSDLKQRTVFFASFPNYIDELRQKYPDNIFLRYMTQKSDSENFINTMQIHNARNLDPGILYELRKDFQVLPDNVKNDIILYGLITYGFKDTNNSFMFLTGSKPYVNFSSWFENAKIDTAISSEEVLVKTAKLIPYDVRVDYRGYDIGTATRARYIRINESIKSQPMIYRQEDGDKIPVSSPYYSQMNSYNGTNTIVEGARGLNMSVSNLLEVVNDGETTINKVPFFPGYMNRFKRVFRLDADEQYNVLGDKMYVSSIMEDGKNKLKYSDKKPVIEETTDTDEGKKNKKECKK